MNQIVTEGIILARTDYGEADRILTLLTPDQGKLRLLAKGVRRVKSKLAGGIELFSVSTITFVRGRGEIGTLVSTRLIKHYGHIVQDLDRTMMGYELIKQLNRATEDEVEPEYFDLLHAAFEALDDPALPLPLVQLWFIAGLLRVGGHGPNLQTDTNGAQLRPDQSYIFDTESMAFTPEPEHGPYGANHIKLLRLAFAGQPPKRLAAIGSAADFAAACLGLVQAMARSYITS